MKVVTGFFSTHDFKVLEKLLAMFRNKITTILTRSTSKWGEWGRWLIMFFVLEVPNHKSTLLIYVHSENIVFFEKTIRYKNIQNFISYNKGLFVFVSRRILPFKRDLAPKNNFSTLSRKVQLLLLLNNLFSSVLFVIKKLC